MSVSVAAIVGMGRGILHDATYCVSYVKPLDGFSLHQPENVRRTDGVGVIGRDPQDSLALARKEIDRRPGDAKKRGEQEGGATRGYELDQFLPSLLIRFHLSVGCIALTSSLVCFSLEVDSNIALAVTGPRFYCLQILSPC